MATQTLSATPSGYLQHGRYPVVDLSPQHLVSEPTTMAFAAEKMSRRILRVTIQDVLYPITESLLHQVFGPYGVVETIEIFPGRSRIVAFIKYGQNHDAARAFQSLQGRNIYDGCCQLGIELLPVSFDKSGATSSAGRQQVATVTEVLQQQENAGAAQPRQWAQPK